MGILQSGHMGAVRGRAVQRQQHAQPIRADACARRACTGRANAWRANARADGAGHGAARWAAQALTPAEPMGGEIADASVSNSWAALLPGGPADDHAAALVEAPSGKLYAGRSLWGMLPAHEPRRSAIRLIELRWFDMVILLTIGANCATMAWESPLDAMLHPEGTWKSDFIDVCEWIYLIIFTFEMFTKIVACAHALARTPCPTGRCSPSVRPVKAPRPRDAGTGSSSTRMRT